MRRRGLSAADLAREQGQALPNREAMSLLLPTTGTLPADLGATTDLAASDGVGYAGAAQDTALTESQDAQTAALDPNADATTQNNPDGTATASSAT